MLNKGVRRVQSLVSPVPGTVPVGSDLDSQDQHWTRKAQSRPVGVGLQSSVEEGGWTNL